MKSWKELNLKEKFKIASYRRKNNNWWIKERILGLVLGIIAILSVIIFIINNNTLFLIVGLLFVVFEYIVLIPTIKEQKEWYEKNKNEIYENKIVK